MSNIKKPWEFFDNFDEVVYVSDIDSYELVYLNKKCIKQLGLKPDDFIGKTCYNVLQNNSSPCSICNNSQLQPGCFLKWNHYNPNIKKHMILHDTMLIENGRRLRMEIAIDVSRQKEREAANEAYADMERLVNDAIDSAMQKTLPSDSMQCMLESIGQMLNGDRAYIFEKNSDGGMDNTYEWVAAGVTPQKHNLQNVPRSTFDVWYRCFKKDKMVLISEIEDTRESDPAIYEYLKPQNITSLLVIPFSLSGGSLDDESAIDGFYGVDNPPADSLEHTKTLLNIMGNFILGMLKRRNLVRELERMSLQDQQTGLGNRHAMNRDMARIGSCEKLGVVYCDITGLKRVNDTKGHAEGDKLILRTSRALTLIFGDYQLYRIGGDEFLVICREIEGDVLEKKATLLKKTAAENDALLSVGTEWTSDGSISIEALMAKAEAAMYEDKSTYYRQSGIDRRVN